MDYLAALRTLIIVAIVLIVCSLFSRRLDTCEKKDKGVELIYWKLSYRRKFIRTLWMIPVVVVLIIWFHVTFQALIWTCIAAVMCGVLLLAQGIYNYKKWKNEE